MSKSDFFAAASSGRVGKPSGKSSFLPLYLPAMMVTDIKQLYYDLTSKSIGKPLNPGTGRQSFDKILEYTLKPMRQNNRAPNL
jgi:hypothetical protein